jgi:hypothetical protein
MATTAEIQPTPSAGPAANDEPRRAPLRGAALWAAIAVLIAFAIFVAYLIGQVDTNEVPWTRLAWLFTSVEAIAFGAAGALFGASIQRQRAEKAEAAASENADQAAKGRALAATLKADEQTARGGGGLESLETPEASEAVQVAQRHASLARELFP